MESLVGIPERPNPKPNRGKNPEKLTKPSWKKELEGRKWKLKTWGNKWGNPQLKKVNLPSFRRNLWFLGGMNG